MQEGALPVPLVALLVMEEVVVLVCLAGREEDVEDANYGRLYD